MILLDDLIEVCSILWEPWGREGWYEAAPATPASVARIQSELNAAVLPPEFIRLSQQCPAYGGGFASIGENWDAPNHLLRLNREWHGANPSLPKEMVLLNHGLPSDSVCLNPLLLSDDGQPMLVAFDDTSRPYPNLLPSAYYFPSYAAYLEHLCRARVVHLKGPNRLRAQELLGEAEDDW